jgi:hypothetical protein
MIISCPRQTTKSAIQRRRSLRDALVAIVLVVAATWIVTISWIILDRRTIC